jgi:hypothetical protein
MLHCKKRLVVFPSSAGMSVTKLSLAGNNLVIPRQTYRLGTEKPPTFYTAYQWFNFNIFSSSKYIFNPTVEMPEEDVTLRLLGSGSTRLTRVSAKQLGMDHFLKWRPKYILRLEGNTKIIRNYLVKESAANVCMCELWCVLPFAGCMFLGVGRRAKSIGRGPSFFCFRLIGLDCLLYVYYTSHRVRTCWLHGVTAWQPMHMIKDIFWQLQNWSLAPYTCGIVFFTCGYKLFHFISELR